MVGNYVPRAGHCTGVEVAGAQAGRSGVDGDVCRAGGADLKPGHGACGRYFVTFGSWGGQIGYICTEKAHLRRLRLQGGRGCGPLPLLRWPIRGVGVLMGSACLTRAGNPQNRRCGSQGYHFRAQKGAKMYTRPPELSLVLAEVKEIGWK